MPCYVSCILMFLGKSIRHYDNISWRWPGVVRVWRPRGLSGSTGERDCERKGEGCRERGRERENKKRQKQKQSRSRGTAVYRKGTFRRRAASTEEESLVQFSHLLFCFHVKSSLTVACVDVTVSSSSVTFISVILLFLKKISSNCVFWSSFAECVCVFCATSLRSYLCV